VRVFCKKIKDFCNFVGGTKEEINRLKLENQIEVESR
jgi:hypothetical protein